MISMRLSFGAEFSEASYDAGGLTLRFAARALGETSEAGFPLPDGPIRREGACLAWDGGTFFLGWARGEKGESLEDSIGRLYEDMFRVTGSRFLYRIWHFVPRINIFDTELENYLLFCRGRAEAFRRAFGDSYTDNLPAASAVGSGEEEPVMLFVGGIEPPHYAENPEQVPAYHYPVRYGPRSPSFARASQVNLGRRQAVFISGTASIKGSETVHPGHCGKQVETTLHNLALISESVGLGPDLGRALGAARSFVIYLRREEDIALVNDRLEKSLFGPGDEKIYLLADICRSDLMVEIEATVLLPPTPPPA